VLPRLMQGADDFPTALPAAVPAAPGVSM